MQYKRDASSSNKMTIYKEQTRRSFREHQEESTELRNNVNIMQKKKESVD